MKALGSAPARLRFEPNDHQTDALVTAAGMRALRQRAARLRAGGLTPALARTEGWTFGVALAHWGRSRAGLAQLVEQRFCKPKVAGSIPATGTTQFPVCLQVLSTIAKCQFSRAIPGGWAGANHGRTARERSSLSNPKSFREISLTPETRISVALHGNEQRTLG